MIYFTHETLTPHITRIRDGIRREFGYGLEPKVLRIVQGFNQGITELILREY